MLIINIIILEPKKILLQLNVKVWLPIRHSRKNITGKAEEYGSQAAIHVCFDWRWPLVIFREKDGMNRDLFGKINVLKF